MFVRCPQLVSLLALSLVAQNCTPARSGPLQQSGPLTSDATIRTDSRTDGSNFQPSDSGGAVLVDGQVCNTTGSGTATRQPATMMFVMDTSGSMKCLVGETDVQCEPQLSQPLRTAAKWNIFRTAFTTALDGIPMGHTVGMSAYPDYTPVTATTGTIMCPPRIRVNFGLIETVRPQIASYLNGVQPAGPTPTSSAMFGAYDALASTAGNNKFVILATDGAATCIRSCRSCGASPEAIASDTALLQAEVARARTAGIRTFVIGVPGSSEFTTQLSELANAGGGMFFDLNGSAGQFGAQLAAAFGNITSSTIGCTYNIPPNPNGAFDVSNVNVRYTNSQGVSRTIPRSVSGTGSGWNFDSASPPTRIEILGATCEEVRGDQGAGARVELLFGCPTVIP